MQNDLLLLLDKMQDSFSAFQKEQNLSCPTGCGACCLFPEIEASPKELIPLALHVVIEGRADYYLHKLDNSGAACILYEAHSADGKKGRCGGYAHRPSICRFFGVGGVSSKLGGFRYSVCSELKEDQPKAYKEMEEKRPIPPLISDWMGELMSLDPELITRQMPINDAFKEALCRVLLFQDLSLEAGATTHL